ncbi:unnamed protein product [Amoebophrya sp. A25]|nr:unnamed protein product [Amoebophrya sp. A25]|eukprot:GSA25T00006992001.1
MRLYLFIFFVTLAALPDFLTLSLLPNLRTDAIAHVFGCSSHSSCVQHTVLFFSALDTVFSFLSLWVAPMVGRITDKRGRRGVLLFFLLMNFLNAGNLALLGERVSSSSGVGNVLGGTALVSSSSLMLRGPPTTALLGPRWMITQQVLEDDATEWQKWLDESERTPSRTTSSSSGLTSTSLRQYEQQQQVQQDQEHSSDGEEYNQLYISQNGDHDLVERGLSHELHKNVRSSGGEEPSGEPPTGAFVTLLLFVFYCSFTAFFNMVGAVYGFFGMAPVQAMLVDLSDEKSRLSSSDATNATKNSMFQGDDQEPPVLVLQGRRLVELEENLTDRGTLVIRESEVDRMFSSCDSSGSPQQPQREHSTGTSRTSTPEQQDKEDLDYSSDDMIPDEETAVVNANSIALQMSREDFLEEQTDNFEENAFELFSRSDEESFATVKSDEEQEEGGSAGSGVEDDEQQVVDESAHAQPRRKIENSAPVQRVAGDNSFHIPPADIDDENEDTSAAATKNFAIASSELWIKASSPRGEPKSSRVVVCGTGAADDAGTVEKMMKVNTTLSLGTISTSSSSTASIATTSILSTPGGAPTTSSLSTSTGGGVGVLTDRGGFLSSSYLREDEASTGGGFQLQGEGGGRGHQDVYPSTASSSVSAPAAPPPTTSTTTPGASTTQDRGATLTQSFNIFVALLSLSISFGPAIGVYLSSVSGDGVVFLLKVNTALAALALLLGFATLPRKGETTAHYSATSSTAINTNSASARDEVDQIVEDGDFEIIDNIDMIPVVAASSSSTSSASSDSGESMGPFPPIQVGEQMEEQEPGLENEDQDVVELGTPPSSPSSSSLWHRGWGRLFGSTIAIARRSRSGLDRFVRFVRFRSPVQEWKGVSRILKHSPIIFYAALLRFVLSVASTGLQEQALYYLQEVGHLKPSDTSILFFFVGISGAIVSSLVAVFPSIAKRIFAIIRIGTFLNALHYFIFVLLYFFPSMWIACLAEIAVGVSFPAVGCLSSLVALAAKPSEVGRAQAAVQSAGQAGRILGPALFASVFFYAKRHGIPLCLPYLVGAIMMLFGVVITVFRLRKRDLPKAM